jgi:hypothetical protein
MEPPVPPPVLVPDFVGSAQHSSVKPIKTKFADRSLPPRPSDTES